MKYKCILSNYGVIHELMALSERDVICCRDQELSKALHCILI